MNNEVIIVPDVHCRDFYKPVLEIKDKPVIFLGDYMDPYLEEGFSNENGYANLEEIIDFAKNNSNVHLLVGNHDVSYIWSYLGWERTPYKWYKDLHRLYRDDIHLFSPFIKIDNVLFIHAGISKGWLSSLENTFGLNINKDNIFQFIVDEWTSSLKKEVAEGRGLYSYMVSHIFDVGRIRGGHTSYGGPFWSDVREMENPFDNIIQIFSHTQLYKTGSFINITKVRNHITAPAYCCDSRAIFIWKNNKLNVYEQD